MCRQVQDMHSKAIYPNREGAHFELVTQLQKTLQEARTAIEQLSNDAR